MVMEDLSKGLDGGIMVVRMEVVGLSNCLQEPRGERRMRRDK